MPRTAKLVTPPPAWASTEVKVRRPMRPMLGPPPAKQRSREIAKRSPQTAAKREREQAKREKRERKLAKKAAAAAGNEPDGSGETAAGPDNADASVDENG